MNGPQIVIAALALSAPIGIHGQVATGPPDSVSVAAYSSDAVRRARAAQARFERDRVRHFPVTLESFDGSCDEHVGRFCSWYDEGDWYPEPESAEIGALRNRLLDTLISVQREVPENGWVLGQRIWYLVEGGRVDEALGISQDCNGADPWWCAALQGFVLHNLGRYGESSAGFRRALRLMDVERARLWRSPRRAMDREGREFLDDLRNAAPDSIDAILDRLWVLADPLYLVGGNDRETEHYSRWTVATLKEDSRQPYPIRWGLDMQELTIRHGWEIAWERSPNGSFSALDNVVGHKHPEGRDFMPPGLALRDPSAATRADLEADRSSPRSLYAPAYAPVVLPMDAQVAVFPRGEQMVVVATYFLPEDTTRFARLGHAAPWRAPGDQAGMSDVAGIFLVPVRGGQTRSVTSSRRDLGALMIQVPSGEYVVSAEAWSPERRRAGRARFGIARRAVPDDVAVLSDLVLLSPHTTDLTELEAAVPLLLARPEIRTGEDFAVGWEVSGLGFRSETLEFQLSVARTGRGVLGRIGDFLHFTRRPIAWELTWQETGPPDPGHAFHLLNLSVPDLKPGEYRIELVLRTPGRTHARALRSFRVTDVR